MVAQWYGSVHQAEAMTRSAVDMLTTSTSYSATAGAALAAILAVSCEGSGLSLEPVMRETHASSELVPFPGELL